MRKITSITQAIGNTPLVRLSKLVPGKVNLYAKMEYLQPGGSVKDRAALRVIQDAYACGDLKKNQPVIEMTSGNMGAGLAIVCSAMGNPFTAVMSVGNSPERAKMMRSLGAEVILTSQVDGTPGHVTGRDFFKSEEVARELAQARGAYYVDQFNRSGCMTAHFEGTGPEIYEALEGKIDAFIATVGSGGTLIGCSTYFKKMNQGIITACVEPANCAILAGKPVTSSSHLIQGTGYSIIPHHWDKSVVDQYYQVTDDEVLDMTRRLAREEGMYVGYSAGANVCAALKMIAANDFCDGANLVTILCDTGLKYSFP
ncbi:MAG: cysteine synthase family protein [Candidatus Cloacimonetes bacterium]|nr:cysteine synthase family protein [Candidatus Cloacimonadota bacterium]